MLDACHHIELDNLRVLKMQLLAISILLKVLRTVVSLKSFSGFLKLRLLAVDL
jgi:hypothetical protein